MLKEFKEFALKGNLSRSRWGWCSRWRSPRVVTAFIDGIIMPLIAAIVGEPSFDAIVWTIGRRPDATEILIGTFISRS